MLSYFIFSGEFDSGLLVGILYSTVDYNIFLISYKVNLKQ